MVESVAADANAPWAARVSSARAWAVAAAITALCWAIAVRDAGRMAGGMPMPGGWTMSMAFMVMPGQSIPGLAVMFLTMWEVMMIAMMLPSAMPTVLLYRRLMFARRARGDAAAPQIVLLAGYFAVWLAFGAAAFVIGVVVSTAAMRSDAVSRAIPAATGLALVAAGLYQLTPLKRACLQHCRSPLSFFAASWRAGWWGTFRLGLHHGAYCAACCWALMLVQLALGVMDVRLMIAVAAVIALEKASRHGERIARLVGVLSIAAGLYLAVRAVASL